MRALDDSLVMTCHCFIDGSSVALRGRVSLAVLPWAVCGLGYEALGCVCPWLLFYVV